MRFRIRPGVALAVAASLSAAGCRRASSAAPQPAPLEGVEVAGCAALAKGPVCELAGERKLSFWVPDAVEVRSDAGEPVVEPARPVGGGSALRVTVPAEARRITLTTRGSPVRSFSLTLAPIAKLAVLDEAKALRSAGKLEEAERVLAAAKPPVQNRILGELARIRLARGDVAGAVRTFGESMDAGERAGRGSEVALDAVACAYALTKEPRLGEAEAVLARAAKAAPDDAEAAARIPYYRGLVEALRGDLRRALASFRDAEGRADRLGMEALRRNAVEQIALVSSDLGRDAEAIELQRSLLSGIDAEPPCERSDVPANLAWMLLRSRADVAEARRHADRALALLGEAKCEDPFRKKNAHLTAALAAADPKRASQELDRARPLAPESVELGLWQLDLEAQAARDPALAERLYARQAELAERFGARDALWRARTGQATALAARGHKRDAISRMREAEALLDKSLLGVPLTDGRDTFLTARDTSARRLVRWLLDAGEREAALEVARRARSRVLRSAARADRLSELTGDERRRWDAAIGRYHAERRALEKEAEQDWTLPGDRLEATRAARAVRQRAIAAALEDALAVLGGGDDVDTSPPAEGELVLAYFPTESGWVGFARTASALEVVELGDKPAGSALLEPFSSPIRAAQRISILPYGALRDVDFHALVLDGEPLIARAPVAYALDLPRAERARQPGALVIADPLGDLPHARREAELVRAELGSATLLSGPGATRSAVLEALAGADLVHYAGHATFAAGALELAGRQKLSVGDVLALARAPRSIVLSACEAGRAEPRAAPEGLGLAHAFVARGAEVVIAATRPVNDAAAMALMKKLYRTDREAMADALRRAQLELWREKSTADWAAFRAITP